MHKMHAASDKKMVSESAVTFLHAQIVRYHLQGHGGRFVEGVEGAAMGVDDSEGRGDDGYGLAALSAKRKRLDSMGNLVGQRLVERLAMDRRRLDNDLDMVKFICKDFWECIFNKHVDVLRTNHRGLYVLTDNNFRWLAAVGATRQRASAAEDYVVLPCGLICGALTRLGVKCRVTAEVVPLGCVFKCSFNVQVIES